MWKTSFIQFLKIIRQNKFFTFLNLFGVSITIMIILVAAIKIESTIWPGGPEKNNKNQLFLNRMVVRNEEKGNMSSGGLNRALIEDYISKMTTPKAIAFSRHDPWSYFGENGVEEFTIRSVNAGWWQVFDYEFLEGRSFNQQEVTNSSMVVVIDQRLKNRFFQDKKAVGQMLEVSGKIYKVMGVVKNVPTNCETTFANIYSPYTSIEGFDQDLLHPGAFDVTFLCNEGNAEAIKTEFENLRIRISPLFKEGYNVYFGGPDSPVDNYLRGWDNPSKDKISYRPKIITILGKFLLLMLLPALNLISIQLIRIHERSEEIGVRKAFGASRGELIKQILYENTLLTIIGAILGLFFALMIVYGFKDFLAKVLFSDFLQNSENIQFHINFGLFFISLLASLVLSFMSGIIPAIKMSRLQAVEVLKGGEL